MKYHIQIGMLAEFFGISKQTLIHYDKIGLLKPSQVGDNKYRYYSYDDVDKLDLIITLKESGLKLSEIKDFLVAPSMDESIRLIENQSERLEDYIQHLSKLKKKIDYRLSELKFINRIEQTDEIKLVRKMKRPVLSEFTREDEFKPGTGLDIFNRFKRYMESHDMYQKYAHAMQAVTISKESLISENYNELKSVFIFIDDYLGLEKECFLQEGWYVCTQHRGPYRETYKTYDKMMTYIKKEHLQINGDAIELPIIAAWGASSSEDYITEIQIPVKKLG